ncbi:uncharacterized protein LOC132755188 [Ruditapes philippinarum]|uniref:uncharacterized protein LOC132755188 n=1 Tax=Ruditapes philippinarum TaxID=129788 RepID=UPI00295BADAF|nr:uncharacterized protein LOC132755188 [Ruditapes philippinarum]
MSSACLVSKHGLDEFNPKFSKGRKRQIKDVFGMDEDIDCYTNDRRLNYDILKIGNEFGGNNLGDYDDDCIQLTDYRFAEKVDKSNGRPGMQHPTKVYGEVTRPWTPVFAMLEHKYIDKKVGNCAINFIDSLPLCLDCI